jgi:hypothetical protein
VPAVHPGVVRFSRSLGLPELSPDILGMAIRLEDAHGPERPQDLLLVTSGDGAVIHHLFAPGVVLRPAVLERARLSGEGSAFLVGARLAPGSPRPEGNGSEFADLDAAASTGRLRYDIGVAPVNGRLTQSPPSRSASGCPTTSTHSTSTRGTRAAACIRPGPINAIPRPRLPAVAAWLGR